MSPYCLRTRSASGDKQFKPPSKSQRAALSEQKRLRSQVVKKGLVRKPSHTNLGLQINPVTRKALLSLFAGGETRDVADNVIEMCLFQVCQHVNEIRKRAAPGQTPACYLQSHKWSKKLFKNKAGFVESLRDDGIDSTNFMQVEYFFIPMAMHYPSEDAHSQLLIISPLNKTIEFCCSGTDFDCPSLGNREIAEACRLLDSILGRDFIIHDWRVRRGQSPQQGATANCAIHTATEAMNTAFGYSKDYTGQDLLNKRKRLASELLAGRSKW